MSRLARARFVNLTLLSLLLSGCQSTPVGTTLPSGGASKFVTYAAPDSSLGLYVSSSGHLNGYTGLFIADPTYDNHASRPSGIPSTYVAYTTTLNLNGGHTYYGDLMTNAGTSTNPDWEFVDDVDPWTANTLIFITPDP